MTLLFWICDIIEVKMKISDQYIRSHEIKGVYAGTSDGSPCTGYKNLSGWTDRVIDGNMIFSHRDTVYGSREEFTEGLHMHEYYELLIYIGGDVEYIKDNSVIRPMPLSAIWFAPGQVHTARLISPSRYERYVMYFSDDFFEIDGKLAPVTDFMKDPEASALALGKNMAEEILTALKKADLAAKSDQSCAALIAKAYILQIFGALSASDEAALDGDRLDEDIAEVKDYIDREYASIPSTADIAEHFYYSREHLSRKFKNKFNISISDYLTKRRITESLALIGNMTVAEASYAVGFRSQSSYIAAFVKNVGCLPSEYKKRIGLQSR